MGATAKEARTCTLNSSCQVCSFEQKNFLMNNYCRNSSRYEIKMVGNNCELKLKDVNEQDAGCYEFYMPFYSENFLYRICVDLDEICPSTVKGICPLHMHWLFQFIWCLFWLAASIPLALVYYKKTTVRASLHTTTV